MANDYSTLDPYGNYGDSDGLTPYELLMQMKAWNKAIYLRIENSDKQIRTELSILDGEIRQNVADVKNGLETLVSTTASGIYTNITNTKSELQNEIITTASGINTRITDTKNGLENQITQTAAGIQTSITDTKNGLQTQINLNAQGIASKVSSSDFNGTKITSLITQTSSAISALAQSLNLSGYVTFNSLTSSGTTVIDGARIQTGLISADRLNAQTIVSKLIQAGGIDASYITSGTISSNLLSAQAIQTTLLYAGGISADLIQAGQFSGDRIYGGTISGSTLYGGYISGGSINVQTDIQAGGYLYLNSGNSGVSFGNYSMISDSYGTLRITGGSGVSITSPLGVFIEGYAQSRTYGLGFGYSSNGRLYVSMNGSDVGFVTLT